MPDKPSALSSVNHPPVDPKSARWSDLRVRVLSAAVLVPLALGCIWIGGAIFAGLVALISAGLAYEWIGLCRLRPTGQSPHSQPSLLQHAVIFAALPLSVMLTERGATNLAVILLAVAAIAAAGLTRGVSSARPLAFGIPYLGLGAVALVWLRQQPQVGGTNVIVLLLVIWASDIGAYAAGRAIGGPRLAPSVSPGKTWSGAAGGLIAAGAVGFAAAGMLGHGSVSLRSIILRPALFAVLIGLIGQAGDLFESLLKRHFGVKDSGRLIPGHGGLLDRLDALLTAAPATALLALILGRGVVLWE